MIAKVTPTPFSPNTMFKVYLLARMVVNAAHWHFLSVFGVLY